MKSKPAKLYLLMNEQGEPFRHCGEVVAYNSKGKALKKAQKLYDQRALLYAVCRAGYR